MTGKHFVNDEVMTDLEFQDYVENNLRIDRSLHDIYDALDDVALEISKLQDLIGDGDPGLSYDLGKVSESVIEAMIKLEGRI